MLIKKKRGGIMWFNVNSLFKYYIGRTLYIKEDTE
jgi:hypothetical protein